MLIEQVIENLLVTNDAARIGRAREFGSDRNALARRGLPELRQKKLSGISETSGQIIFGLQRQALAMLGLQGP